MDRQLKVRGFRVEPGEIESVLAGHPDIDQVSVVASPSQARATPAWSPTTRRPAPRRRRALHHPRAASLRRYLLDRLPGYMIPAAFIARHPSRPDGRPARAAGDARAPGGPGRCPRSAAAGPAARAAHAHARRDCPPCGPGCCSRDHVGLDDDFFALGGNSLLAAEMLAHTRRHVRDRRATGAPAHPLPAARPHAARVRRRRAGRPRGQARRRRRPGRDRLRPRGQAQPQGPRRCRARAAPAARHAPRLAQARARSCSPGRPGSSVPTCCSELLAATTARVLCLVRARDERARAAARHHGTPPTATSSRRRRGDRVVPLPGDLAEPRLGLSAGDVPRAGPERRHHLPRGRAGELHLPVRGTAGGQRGGHPRGDPARRRRTAAFRCTTCPAPRCSRASASRACAR